MEVFVAYTGNDIYPILEQTLNAWAECDQAEPVMLEIKSEKKFEIERRILADNLAKGRYYILADIGCAPGDAALIAEIQRKINDDKFSGMAGLWPDELPAEDVPFGVRVCEKGIVKKWVTKRTLTYNEEHAESVRLAGKSVAIWPDISFTLVQASSQS